MANLDRIVNVQISLNTTGVSKEGFSTGLIVGAHFHSLARVETYTGIDAMISDGFSENEPVYKAAADFFSQTPRPRSVKIGRRKCDGVSVTVTDVVPQGTYAVTISTKDITGNVTKTPFSYKNSGGNEESIITGIAALITADKKIPVTATAETKTLKIKQKDSNIPFAVTVSSNLTAMSDTVTETIAQSMAAITATDNDFYGIILASREQADILAMAEWTEAHIKLFGTAIAEEGAKDAAVSTDTGYKLMNNNLYRTFWFYHKDAATDYPEAAVMARCFAIDPGGETWANKKLAGVTTDGLTETEYNAITKKNGNTFERFRNISITQNGKVAAGEWIDVIRFRDWLQEEITTNVFGVMINSDKIPYTDAGIAIVEAQIRAALKEGQDKGGIAPDEVDSDGNTNLGFTVHVPLAADISPNQKASRVLTDVTFTARLAGAIHAVDIKGGLTYENLITTR